MTSESAQAELVRRLERLRAGSAPLEDQVFGRLVERARHRATPGRGRAAGEAEVLRLGTGLLVDLLLGAPDRNRRNRSGPARATARVTVLGAPGNAAAVRELFPARRFDRREPLVLVQAAGLDETLAQVWSARVVRGSQARWAPFVTRFARRDSLPDPADLALLAESATRPVQTHIVLAAGPAAARRTTAQALGLREPAEPSRALDAPAVEVVRRANEVLAVRVPGERAQEARERLVDTLLPLRSTPGDAVGISVPPRHREWAAGTSERLIEHLRRGRYPVHGDLDLLRSPGDFAPRPGVARALAVTLRACLRLAGAEQRAEVRRR